MLFYTLGNGLTLCLQFSLHKICECKHYGCLPKNDTHADSFSVVVSSCLSRDEIRTDL